MRVEIRSKGDMQTDATCEAFCLPLREAVQAKQHLGRKLAIFEVSRFFGLTERRVKSAVYGEVRQVLAVELLQVQRRLADYLDAEARRLDAKAALLRARRAALGQVLA